MIQKEQLMIGNWVNTFAGRSVEVVSIGQTELTVFLKSENIRLPFDKFNPIPLDPTILEKCGFQWESSKKKHLQLYTIWGMAICAYFEDSINYTELQVYQESYFDGFMGLTNIKYLHQLQNLYFALTGSPLKIEL